MMARKKTSVDASPATLFCTFSFSFFASAKRLFSVFSNRRYSASDKPGGGGRGSSSASALKCAGSPEGIERVVGLHARLDSVGVSKFLTTYGNRWR